MRIKGRFAEFAINSGLVMSSATKQSFNRYLGYDNTGRLRLQFTDSIPEPFSATFGYDGLGRVVADTSGVVDVDSCDHDAALGWSCGYDSVEGIRRLAYDSLGNVKRDSLWDNLGFVGADTGGYEVGNRIKVFGTCTYGHDDDGNVTSRACGEDSLTLWWSSDNRLDSLKLNGATTRFYYDAFGRLVRRNASGTVTYFWWDGANLYAELNSSRRKLVEYLYGGMDTPRAIADSNGTVYFAGIDGLGNVIGLESHTGGDGAAYAYDLWGNNSGWENLPSGATNRARFKGAMWMGDAGPELYHMRARWYEPNTGRFLSEDPIGLAGGMNPYLYAGDDHVNGWDPTGLLDCQDGVSGYWQVARIWFYGDWSEEWFWISCPRQDAPTDEHAAVEEYSGSRLGRRGVGHRPTAAERKAVCHAAIGAAVFALAQDALVLSGVGMAAGVEMRFVGRMSENYWIPVAIRTGGYLRAQAQGVGLAGVGYGLAAGAKGVMGVPSLADGGLLGLLEEVGGWIPVVNVSLATARAVKACR